MCRLEVKARGLQRLQAVGGLNCHCHGQEPAFLHGVTRRRTLMGTEGPRALHVPKVPIQGLGL